MSNTSRSEKNVGQSFERSADYHIDPSSNFDLWAGAVKQQMLSALKKRERMRNA